ncbi:unnamed protein product [Rhizoctonia solani]|uniref:Protein kinase domain-containing protein n=1 Tax=Rhizoctonia solani TaxID=456999 RepID=A0A8H2XSH0_9AGAM|nr:unnamed protein product [Rhizoctonia solani]
MGSNSNDDSSWSEDAPPWLEHTLQITTPKYKYTGRGDERVGPPLIRAYHSSSVVSSPSGAIYIFGGETGSGLRNDIWAIRVSGDSDLPLGPERKPRHMKVTASLVETTGEKPSPRSGHNSALAGGLLVVWGGVTSIVDGKSAPPDDNSVYTLNMTTHRWTKLDIQPAPSARTRHAACIYGNHFIVFGGRLNSREYLNDLWRIDLWSPQGTLKWEQIELDPWGRLPRKRAWHTMVTFREKLYVFGGANYASLYNDTWCFDMATRVWTELSCTGPTPRAYRAAALVGDTVYIFGGMDNDRKPLGDTWSLKIDGIVLLFSEMKQPDMSSGIEQKWYRFPSVDSERLRRLGHILAATDGYVLLIGGLWKNQYKYEYSEHVHILDTGRIDYSEEREEITLKTMPPIKQSGSAQLAGTSLSRSVGGIARDIGSKFGVIQATSIESEADAGLSELVAATDILMMDRLGVPPEEHPPAETAAVLPSTRDTITGAMSATEILQCLVVHGCRDISNELDILHVTEFPVSSGGFGDVYCATLRNGNRIGLKCMRMLVGSTERGRKSLKHAAHELYVWSKCSHPNILELSGVMIYRDQIAMVSPWVGNGHLRWFLSQHPQANRCALCVDIADGVAYMHKKGIIHGDMKPENILISKDHTPKLTDFGNAVISEYTLQFSQSDSSPSMSMRWTSPEIINETTKITQAGDIYALGMIIFEVITGILPYDGVKEPAIMCRILAGNVPSRLETHMPSGVEQADQLWSLITICWAFDPKKRPEAQEVRNILGGITPEGLLANPS